MADGSSGTARYNRHARLELRLKVILHPFHPILSFHRHVGSPLERKAPADRLYELVEREAGGFMSKAVLDAGCGFGGLLAWAAVHRNVQVAGITMSDGQVTWSRRYLGRYGVSPDSISLGNYDNLPANRFDVIVAIESLIHSVDLNTSLRSMHDALHPGGTLIIVDDFWNNPDADFASLLRDLDWGISAGLTLESTIRSAECAGLRLAGRVDLTSRVRLEPTWMRELVLKLISRVPLRKGSFAESRANFYRALLLQNAHLKAGQARYHLIRFAKPA